MGLFHIGPRDSLWFTNLEYAIIFGIVLPIQDPLVNQQFFKMAMLFVDLPIKHGDFQVHYMWVSN